MRDDYMKSMDGRWTKSYYGFKTVNGMEACATLLYPVLIPKTFEEDVSKP